MHSHICIELSFFTLLMPDSIYTGFLQTAEKFIRYINHARYILLTLNEETEITFLGFIHFYVESIPLTNCLLLKILICQVTGHSSRCTLNLNTSICCPNFQFSSSPETPQFVQKWTFFAACTPCDSRTHFLLA